jgi:hypothetical protein
MGFLFQSTEDGLGKRRQPAMIDKKEIKRQYKETKQPMGIYRIANLVNGKIYIGSSKSVDTIFNSARFQLKMGSYFIRDLQEDFTRCGEAKFLFDVVDYLESNDDPEYDYSDDLRVLEEMWLEKLQPYDEKGYNSRKTKTV